MSEIFRRNMRAIDTVVDTQRRPASQIEGPQFPPADLRRIIVESGNVTFARREVLFGGVFTHERAKRAFEDYKAIRDLRDKVDTGVFLQRELESRRKMGKRKDIAEIEKRIRLNETIYNPSGGEVSFLCADKEEAKQRVYELIGPARPDSRELRYRRPFAGQNRGRKNDNGPCNGFEYVARFQTHGTLQQFSRSWLIDNDPVKKGPHFNVIVRPAAILISGEERFLDEHDPESLDIAFIFPGGEDEYDTTLHMVENSAINSLVNGGHDLDYLEEVEL